MDEISRPQVVTTIVGEKCLAIIGWDYSATASDGKSYLNDRVEVWDIGVPATPTFVSAWLGKAETAAYNHYGTTLMANGGSVMWQYYSDDLGACNVKVHARGDVNAFQTAAPYWGALQPTAFPALRYGQSNGFGYVQPIQSGWQKDLVGTWVQSVCTSAIQVCYTCNVGACSNRSLQITGVLVVP